MRLPGRGDADMTQGVIWKQLLQFSIPMAIGLLFVVIGLVRRRGTIDEK